MADTLTTTTTVSTVPNGTVIATDDAGAGGHVQIVKLAQSGDGIATPITADADGLLVNLGANNDIGGSVAHDSPDSGNPIKIGGKVSTSVPTPVAAADRVDAWLNEYGQLVTTDVDVEMGFAPGTTGLRDELFAQRMTVLADSLADGLSGFWSSSTANGGTATSSGGEGLIQTSANASGSAQITSTTVPYFPGAVGWFNSAVRFGDTGSAGNIRRIGIFTVSGTTPQDGFYYELSGTTLNAVVVKAGTPSATASASWSKVAEAPFTLDTNYHSFEMRYTANTVWFYIDNILRHKVSGTNAAITATLNFPITITSVNTSGATNRLIAVRNCGVGRFGNPDQTVNENGLSAVWATSVGGGTPHDSVDSGNPLKLGGYAKTAAPTAVADADRVNAWFTQNGALNVVPQPHTQGGLSIFRSLDLDETEEDVKTSAGQVYGVWVTNKATSTRWLKFYNATAANVTVGTTTPVITVGIPGNSSDNISGMFSGGGHGIFFDTAICVAATTGFADNDTGAPAANDVLINVFYK